MKLSYEALYNSIMAYSADGIFVTDLEGHILKASNSALKLFMLEMEQIIGFCYFDFISSEDRKQALADINARMQGKNIGKLTCYHAIRANSELFYLEVNTAPMMDSKNLQTGMVMIFRDITERKMQEEELAKANRKLTRLSITDALTGISNRRYFEEMLKSEYARHVRSKKELTIIIADIDHFKNYNDFYGHVHGDSCLRKIAQVLSESVFRSCDLVARYGGEEFALILPDTDLKGALLVAERVRHSVMSLAIPHEASSTATIVTVSFGVASSFCSADAKASSIVDEADKMLYLAKSEGRNRVASCHKKQQSESKSGKKLVPIKWQDEHISGDSMVDGEHQVLIRSINSLLDKKLSPAKLEAHIESLPDEMASHFHNEERLLYAIGYPDTNDHIKEHMKLLGIAISLVLQYKEKRLTVEDLFSFFAYEFTEQHLVLMDSQFYPYLSKKKGS
jgi:diguanylate cyclase (GGDEF)-like protein/PAS domain S-box-containing protein/hemerythrin-like metal-binding protein